MAIFFIKKFIKKYIIKLCLFIYEKNLLIKTKIFYTKIAKKINEENNIKVSRYYIMK